MDKIAYKIKTICPEISKVIQEKLFSIGYKWTTSGKNIVNLGEKTLFLWSNKEITHGFVNADPPDSFLSLTELMSWTNDRVVKLNDAYEVHIYADGIRVNPWAENAWIPFDLLVTLAEALKEAKKGIDEDPFTIDTICPEISEVVQKELFKRGLKWRDGTKDVFFNSKNSPFLDIEGKSFSWNESPKYKVISLEEFFSQSKKEVSVTLTDSWTAVVTKDRVKVGCQTFDIEKVEELISVCRELGKI